ncbi:MAG: hypothetical protein EBY18_08170 [Alphaproteobacteria bacterium]|nr:hypothetical protein [Alphaproteobacteria bacterium]
MLRSIVVALLSLISGSALAVDTTFLLVNSTSYPINQMSISQHDMQMWSPNLFRGPVIKPGESRQIVIPASQLVCQVDMRLGFADGTPPATWQYLNLCNLRKIQVFYDRYSGITTARYDE